MIDRATRTLKERARAVCHSLPFIRILIIMCVSLVSGVTKWINVFPTNSNIIQSMSANAVVEGKSKPDFSYLRINFGTYAMVYLETTNNMKHRSIPAIVLNPSNDHGGHYFMSLFTGKQVNSKPWTEIPMTEEVIERVEDLAKKDGQPLMADGYPIFKRRPGVQIEDEEETLWENYGEEDMNIVLSEEQGHEIYDVLHEIENDNVEDIKEHQENQMESSPNDLQNDKVIECVDKSDVGNAEDQNIENQLGDTSQNKTETTEEIINDIEQQSNEDICENQQFENESNNENNNAEENESSNEYNIDSVVDHRRSTRTKRHVERYVPTFAGKIYQYLGVKDKVNVIVIC